MIEINLLPAELKTKAKKISIGNIIEAKYFLYLVPLVLGLLICAHLFLSLIIIVKNNQLRILNNKWKSLGPQREALESFNREYAALSQDAKVIQQFSNQRINWAEKLNKLSLGLPSGVWFNEISFSPKDFTLQGSVLSLQKEEMSLINKFMDNLKGDPGFFKDFISLELTSVQKKTVGGYDIADFSLAGTLRPKI